MHQRAAPYAAPQQEPVFRWECRCQRSPVLLATYDVAGRINIKVRDRYWHVLGVVATHCPRCGAEHVLDLRETPPDPGATRDEP